MDALSVYLCLSGRACLTTKRHCEDELLPYTRVTTQEGEGRKTSHNVANRQLNVYKYKTNVKNTNVAVLTVICHKEKYQ